MKTHEVGRYVDMPLWMVATIIAVNIISSCSATTNQAQSSAYHGTGPTATVYAKVTLKFPPGHCGATTAINFDDETNQAVITTGAFFLYLGPEWDVEVTDCTASARAGVQIEGLSGTAAQLKEAQPGPEACYSAIVPVSQEAPASRPAIFVHRGTDVCVYTDKGNIALLTITAEPDAANSTFTALATLWTAA
jgi:hypothetical protein